VRNSSESKDFDTNSIAPLLLLPEPMDAAATVDGRTAGWRVIHPRGIGAVSES
jgi:hypothetical protein